MRAAQALAHSYLTALIRGISQISSNNPQASSLSFHLMVSIEVKSGMDLGVRRG